MVFLVISGCVKLCLGLCTGKVKTFFWEQTARADCELRCHHQIWQVWALGFVKRFCSLIAKATCCHANSISSNVFSSEFKASWFTFSFHILAFFWWKWIVHPAMDTLSLLSILWSFRDLWWRMPHDCYDCFSRLRLHHRKLSCIMSEMYTDVRVLSYFSFTDSLTAGVCTKLV